MTGPALAPRRHSALPLNLPPAALSRTEAAAFCGVSPSLFDEMVADGRMPQPKVANARRLWLKARLDSALAALPDADEDRAEANPWDAR